MASLQNYLPMDRRLALAQGLVLPDRTEGAALFADISGFTPLTQTLAQELGRRRGAEEVLSQINPVYNALIAQLHRYGGSVIVFAGDSITCWLDQDDGHRAVACAVAMQRVMADFATVHTPAGTPIPLAIKVAVAVGPARRFLVGSPRIQQFDALAGATLDRMAAAEQLANRGEIVVDAAVVAKLGSLVVVGEWRDGENGRRCGVITALLAPPTLRTVDAIGSLRTLTNAQIKSWLLPPIYERAQTGAGFLAELRPTVPLFIKFSGIDYDNDDAAGDKLNSFTCWVQAVLEQYEGYLLQMPIGDKGSYIFAAFGAPIAHDDDAVRAVGAAFALQSLPEHLHFIQSLQIGISQGLVWAGAVGARTRSTYSVMGDEVNMSARLMAKAMPGQTLVHQRIADAASHQYRFNGLGAVTVKGSAIPIPIAEVVEKRQEQVNALFDSPLVGREETMAELNGYLERSRQRGVAVCLQGNAGIGKSHLVSEFGKQAANNGFRVLLGSCQSVAQSVAYSPWRQIFRGLLDLADVSTGMDTDNQIAWIEMMLNQINPEWQVRLPLLGDLLGLPIADNPTTAAFDPKLRQQALLALTVEIIQVWSQEQPLLFIVDDVHWIDEASTTLTLALKRVIQQHPMMMLLVHRPIVEAEVALLSALAQAKDVPIIDLNELSREASASLVAHRLQGRPSLLTLSLIESKAQGNPFFIEELVDALQELAQFQQRGDGTFDLSPAILERLRSANYVIASGDEWVLAEGADLSAIGLNIPDSIHGAVLSRIDRLPEAQKLTLKIASVIGRTFAFDLLYPSHPNQLSRDVLRVETEAIAKRDFVRIEIPIPRLTYLFKHKTTHEVAYETLLFAQRKRLHSVVAQVLMDLQPDAIESLAHHTFIAEAWPQAIKYQLLVGKQARLLSANHQAIDHFSKALQAAKQCPEAETTRQRQEIFVGLGELYVSTGQYEAAAQHLQQALALAIDLDDVEAQARTCRWFARSYELRGEYEPALAWIEKGLKAVAATKTAESAELLSIAGLINARQGHLDNALTLCQQIQEIAHEVGDLSAQARSYSLMGMITRMKGDSQTIIDYFQKALNLYQDVNNVHGQALAQNQLATAYFDLGLLDKADAFYRQARDTFRQAGAIYDQLVVENNLGGMALRQGRLDDALNFYRHALALLEQIGGSRWVMGVLHMNLGHTFILQGELIRARRHLGRSLAYYDQAQTRDFLPELHRLFAEVALREGDWEVGQQQGELALSLAQELSMRGEEGSSLRVLGKVATQLKQYLQANSHLQESLATLKEVGDEYEWAQTQVALAHLHFEQGQFEAAHAALIESVAIFEPLDAAYDLAVVNSLQLLLPEI